MLTGETQDGGFTGGDNKDEAKVEKVEAAVKSTRRVIEKIVTFYSDETYTIYRPSEK